MTPRSSKAPDRAHVLRDRPRPGYSMYRLLDHHGQEIKPLNDFLDMTAVRGLSERTLRTYAYALLSAWHWISDRGPSINEMTEAHLLDYVRYLRERAASERPPAAQSINLRLLVLRAFFRFTCDEDLPGDGRACRSSSLRLYRRPTFTGSLRRLRQPGPLRLRMKVPETLPHPLNRNEVARFFESLRTYRDLAIVSLMLFCGLRSCEVLGMGLDDLNLLEDEIRVTGKGNKDRVLPLCPQVRTALSSYRRLERPETTHKTVFVNLKGLSRGEPMTPDSIRGVFRYHRKRSGIRIGHAHRFRHTYASDMIRAGMSLPALMRLMGHSQIETTMRYVNLSADDVRHEFEQAIRRRLHESRD